MVSGEWWGDGTKSGNRGMDRGMKPQRAQRHEGFFKGRCSAEIKGNHRGTENFNDFPFFVSFEPLCEIELGCGLRPRWDNGVSG
jgi:hypothetical protein